MNKKLVIIFIIIALLVCAGFITLALTQTKTNTNAPTGAINVGVKTSTVDPVNEQVDQAIQQEKEVPTDYKGVEDGEPSGNIDYGTTE